MAWPGVQPSFSGEGEAPVAKEPQIQVPEDLEDTPAEAAADDTPEVEAKAEETPVDTPMKVAKEGGAAEASIDEDYVADVTAAQGTWDPWPTLAQDDPTPTQDD